MHSNACIFAKHRQVFAKIDLIPQLDDGCLALADRFDRRRR